jgi:hypothetical protein
MWRATILAVAVAAVAAPPTVASATTLTWPGSPGCTGTLQACVDASGSGDTIEIATDTPVDEDLFLPTRSLALTSAPYHHAAFAQGRSIFGLGSAPADIVVSISKLHLRDGHVTLSPGPANATYDVRELDVSQSIGGAAAYIMIQTGQGTVNATVYHNRVTATPADGNSGLIQFLADSATMNAYAAFNTLQRADRSGSDGIGILFQVDDDSVTPGNGTFAAFGNEVHGAFGRGGIAFSEGLVSSIPNTIVARAYANAVSCGGPGGSGLGFLVNYGSIDLQVINNSVSGCDLGVSTIRWAVDATGSFSGPVWNNLVVAAFGLMFTSLTNDYNLVNAGSNLATLGPHTITAPAALSASAPPRLSAASPAIGAADGATLAFGLIDNGFPVLDADGLRRLKLTGADIGAYEYGDVTFGHTASAADTSGNVTMIDDPATNGNTGALVFPTRTAIYGMGAADHNFGIWYSASVPMWTIYYEDFGLGVDPGTAWNVFVPAAGDGAFVQTATAANTSGSATTIDNPMTNGSADRIVLVRHDWTRDATYLDHPVGVFYSGSGSSGRWNIGTVDQTPMPVGMGFDVYAQPASPNAFRINAPTGSNGVQIDHPLINGVACAQVHVTRVYDPTLPPQAVDFDVEYFSSSGMWNVMSSEGFVGGTAFNVVINPAQIQACTDRIFADGFDS